MHLGEAWQRLDHNNTMNRCEFMTGYCQFHDQLAGLLETNDAETAIYNNEPGHKKMGIRPYMKNLLISLRIGGVWKHSCCKHQNIFSSFETGLCFE